ncbi:MAG: hypothetical protein IPJ76_12360 [Flavobacteriales bacterium]|nr:MAG: hypothetical protein IPJ76_12360 [Flavobacteriales bacterium]
MSDHDDLIRADRISAYVSGTLTGAERAAFEADMARDAALANDVELERLLRDTIKHEDVMRFRDRVRKVVSEQELAATKTETKVISIDRSRTWAYIAAAASVALVVTVALWQWGAGGLRQDTLAELNTERGFEFSGTRSGTADAMDEQLNGLRRSGKLEDYLLQSEKALTTDTSFAVLFHDPVRLDRAIVWLRLNEPDKALKELALLRDPQHWEKCESAQVRGLAAALKDEKDRMREEFKQADRAGCLPEGLRALME